MLWLNNADHMGFSHNASRPWPIPNKARDGMQRISKTMILLFLQSWLKEDQEANALFTEAYANTLTDAVVDKVWWYEK